MSKIDKIYISCCKKDLWFTRICVASIRYWYPEIPIYLIKDYLLGSFDTREIERNWNISVLSTKRKKFGWGYPKFEALFSRNNERILAIDSDIVFAGKVLDALEKFDEDFIVSGTEYKNPKTDFIKGLYYDIDKLLELDPSFIFPNFVFNSGQIVATSGKIKQKEFTNLIEWRELPKLKFPKIFSCGDQGFLNYVLTKKQQLGQISLKLLLFHWYAAGVNNKEPILSKIKNGDGFPTLIHWAGEKVPILSRLALNDILYFYEDFYYSRVKFGSLLKYSRRFKAYLKYTLFVLPWKNFRIFAVKVLIAAKFKKLK